MGISMRQATSKSDWKDGFLFVGNQLALDFLNTRPVQNGEPSELLPDFSALLRWFQAADLLSSREVGNLQRQWERSANAQSTTQAMRQLREKLRKEILAWERGGSVQHSTLDELNKLMAEHPMRIRLRTNGKSFAMEIWFQPQRTGRFIRSVGPCCGHIIRDSGSPARPQVRPVRVAFPGHQQERDTTLVQHAALRESLESCGLRGSPTPAHPHMTE